MTRAEYEMTICTRLAQAVSVPFRTEVSLGEWKPERSRCHDNVDGWVSATPSHSAVRGWATRNKCYIGAGSELIPALELVAHSVVCDENGNMFDITPFADECVRQSTLFVVHVGNEESFH